MQTAHPSRTHAATDSTAPLAASLTVWHALVIDLPLRLAAEAMRFTGRRLQAQAEHLTALARCGSLEDAVTLQTTFVTKGVSDYRSEASSLSHEVAQTAFAKAA
jgi:hypothetical protein